MAAVKTFHILSPIGKSINKEKEIDWSLCYICQENGSSELVKPCRHPRYAEHPEESSYHQQASILKKL